jgi:hypothetical protein
LDYACNYDKKKVCQITAPVVKDSPVRGKAQDYLNEEDQSDHSFGGIDELCAIGGHSRASKCLHNEVKYDDADPNPLGLVIDTLEGTDLASGCLIFLNGIDLLNSKSTALALFSDDLK